jgi:hypothetical protein
VQSSSGTSDETVSKWFDYLQSVSLDSIHDGRASSDTTPKDDIAHCHEYNFNKYHNKIEFVVDITGHYGLEDMRCVLIGCLFDNVVVVAVILMTTLSLRTRLFNVEKRAINRYYETF